jgi:hypothetical protein
MAARMYLCNKCNGEQLAFEGEEARLACRCTVGDWKKQPPNPFVVHATSRIMVDYYLDSLTTADEYLEEQIREATDDREALAYQHAVINR